MPESHSGDENAPQQAQIVEDGVNAESDDGHSPIMTENVNEGNSDDGDRPNTLRQRMASLTKRQSDMEKTAVKRFKDINRQLDALTPSIKTLLSRQNQDAGSAHENLDLKTSISRLSQDQDTSSSPNVLPS